MIRWSFCNREAVGVSTADKRPLSTAGVPARWARVAARIAVMAAWHDDLANLDLLNRLRGAIADGGRLLVFLGAGLSFGAARQNGRARFDYERYDGWHYLDHPAGLAPDDDGLPLPSWTWLVNRMYRRLALDTDPGERESLRAFFVEEGPLDCAQLFRQTVGEANYREFLLAQFHGDWFDFVRPTPSHAALVRLDLPLLFTTNYDELIESAYLKAGVDMRVSRSEEEFKAHRTQRPRRHLVKLHGSIDQPDSIVLTRSDYAQARSGRKEMLDRLRSELADGSFLFVGFSLSDPNFNAIHDDLRLVYGMHMPVSYTVQARRNRTKDRYLRSLGVNTVWLDSWNDLPDLLTRIDPKATAESQSSS